MSRLVVASTRISKVIDLRPPTRAQLKATTEKKREHLALGHGEYREIVEDEFLPEVTRSQQVVLHLFHKEFPRCKVCLGAPPPTPPTAAAVSPSHRAAPRVCARRRHAGICGVRLCTAALDLPLHHPRRRCRRR